MEAGDRPNPVSALKRICSNLDQKGTFFSHYGPAVELNAIS